LPLIVKMEAGSRDRTQQSRELGDLKAKYDN
jgi:hypothetical protein